MVAIAYSNEYRFLLSAGSDHQVCVWSPFAEKQVYTLRGHHAPLIGVQFVPGTPQIVTADSAGWYTYTRTQTGRQTEAQGSGAGASRAGLLIQPVVSPSLCVRLPFL